MTRSVVLVSLVVGLGIALACSEPEPAVGPDGRPILTDAQLARLQIAPVPGKDGLFVLPGFDGSLSGGNVAVRVTGDGVILVDDKFPYSFDFITEQVSRVTSEPIRYVLNTHHHGDHAGSNADFMPAAHVVAHRNARVNMMRNDQAGAPSVVYRRQTTVFLGDAEARLYHFGRGHTDGDSVIYFPDLRTVHTGDLFIFGDRMDGTALSPFIDYANGGSGIEWTATLDALLELDVDTVIPGHGPILSKEDVQAFRDKLEQLTTRMRALVEADVSRDDVGTALDIDDLDWPLSVPALQALYDEVAGA